MWLLWKQLELCMTHHVARSIHRRSTELWEASGPVWVLRGLVPLVDPLIKAVIVNTVMQASLSEPRCTQIGFVH